MRYRISPLLSVHCSSYVLGFASRRSRQGLRELGYLEGKNIVIEYRYGQRKTSIAYPRLAAELVHLKVDVILTAGTPADPCGQGMQPRRFPLSWSQDTDPVGNGFVASLARPGGNITGLIYL